MRMKRYNALAYEKIFDTLGAKFWNQMPREIKKDFLEWFILWRTPNLNRRLAVALASGYIDYDFAEFDQQTQHDIRRFQKHYAHTEKFKRWVTD